MRVMPPFCEVEYFAARFDPGTERMSVEQLAFEHREEALTQALSYASPTAPIEGRTPASWHRLPKASEVYWLAWSE